MNQIIAMLTRMLTSRAMGWGIRKGLNRMGKPGGATSATSAKQARMARETTKRARQAARLTRRIGR